MSSTALGAEIAIIFISDAHEKFYCEKIERSQVSGCSFVSIMMQEEISTVFMILRKDRSAGGSQGLPCMKVGRSTEA